MFTAGLSGILLGIISALTGIVFYYLQPVLKKKSALGAALGTTAASSALAPWRWLPGGSFTLAIYVVAATARLAAA
ncbi:2-keto-3-deoxygluconate permease [Klebsiella variicola subsp. variicola]|nr:2-keto-3-deoxygluconate permease [Klebsiella variicola subsp. variicola]